MTDEILLPGYHSYDLQLMYQMFELDALLQDGENEITVMLGKGWYMGRFGFGGGIANTYGSHMTFFVIYMWMDKFNYAVIVHGNVRNRL